MKPLVKYIMLRVKLKSLFDEFEKAREEIKRTGEACKMERIDGMKEWDEKFRPSYAKSG